MSIPALSRAFSESFSIFNDETNTTPFVIENGTANNLLYLDAAERIGINTNVPNVTLHAIGNRIRLRRSTASNAFGLDMRVDGAAVDLEAFNAPLFLHSSGLGTKHILMNPFAGQGNVGIGTISPNELLEVRSNGSRRAVVKVDDNGPKIKRGMFVLENNGAPSFRFIDTSIGRNWEFSLTNLFPEGNFVINEINAAGREFFLDIGGNGVFKGTATATNHIFSSDRNLKDNIEPLDGRAVLSKVMELPISSWSFKKDSDKQRHIGPMAQDFQKIFGGAPDDRHISVADSTGIALAAIQGLGKMVKNKDTQILQLQQELAELRTMVQQITASDQVAMVE